MWPFLSDPPSIVQFIMLIACVPMGLSHIVRPALWIDFFARLTAMGRPGLVLKVLAVELWPALLIVSLHQVWSGPAIVLTLYGWAQFGKVWIALLFPAIGMRSMAMAEKHGARGFVAGGLLLIAVGLSAGAALYWA
ncbi:MAG: hypothetical protein EOP22_13910 [Hyphomicrobiales bacterium]|nr:MAG: hypothetical protein EOP22_13910 [Hyphomicrobiales bacterium]